MINYNRHHIDKKDIKSVVNVLKSDFLTQGKQIFKFEKKLGKFFSCKYACAVSSGTAALHLSAIALNFDKNDYILLSPITFVASANCALYCNSKVEFIDIESDYYTIDPIKLEVKIKQLKKRRKKIKAVIVTDYAGQPSDWKKLKVLSKKYKFFLINDNCHALGAKYLNRKDYAVKFADIVIQSFHPVKNITTGEGGAVLTNNKFIFEKIKLLRSHNIKKFFFNWFYDVKFLGYNYRITDIQSALGISQLSKINVFLKKRRKIAKVYDNLFKNNDIIKYPIVREKCLHAYHLYPIRVNFRKLKISKLTFLKLLRKLGINPQLHYKPVHMLTLYKKKFGKKTLKESEKYYSETLSLPVFYEMTLHQVNFVARSVLRIINKHKKN